MSNSRKWTTDFNANNETIEAGLKASGYRSARKRRELIKRAASGRPADLAAQARQAVLARRAAMQGEGSK